MSILLSEFELSAVILNTYPFLVTLVCQGLAILGAFGCKCILLCVRIYCLIIVDYAF